MGLITGGLFTYPVTKTLDGTRGLLRIGYSPLLRQSLLAGNKPLKEAKGRFKISIDALYYLLKVYSRFKMSSRYYCGCSCEGRDWE
jgi:hypothetical protein